MIKRICYICNNEFEIIGMKKYRKCVKCQNSDYHKNNKQEIKRKKQESFNSLSKEEQEVILKRKAEYGKVYNKKNRDIRKLKKNEYFDKVKRLPRNRWKRAFITAKKRFLTFTLTLEEYTSFITQKCYYCNDFFPKTETGVGLDRINNDKGYEIDNVCSCCGNCNKTRGCIWTQEEAKFIISQGIEFRLNNLKDHL